MSREKAFKASRRQSSGATRCAYGGGAFERDSERASGAPPWQPLFPFMKVSRCSMDFQSEWSSSRAAQANSGGTL